MARGRDADRPRDIPKPGWKDIALRVKDEIGPDHVSLVAAGCAFYGLLALFPGIAAAMAVAGMIVDPQTVSEQLSQLTAVLPEDAASIITDQAQAVTESGGGALGLAAIGGILISIYSASKGVGALMEGLNVVYDEEETRGFVKLTAIRLALTLGLILGLLLAVAILIAVPAALAFLPLGQAAETAISLVRWPILALLAFGGIAMLYRWGPSRDPAQWRWLTPGAALATVLWVLGTLGFAIYVQNFGAYNETFGSLAGVIILLFWMWLSAFLVLLGAEVDAEIEAQTRRDTTTGQREPMGRRGAVKADRLGSAKR